MPKAPGTATSSNPSRELLLNPALVDEYALLLQQKRALETQVRVLTGEGSRFQLLDRQVREAADRRPATDRFLFHGFKFQIECSPKENEAMPDWKKLVRAFSLKALMPWVSITQKAVKQLLASKAEPEAEYEQFFTKSRTGSRKLNVIPKTAPAAVEEAA